MRPDRSAVEKCHAQVNAAFLDPVEKPFPDTQVAPADEGLRRPPPDGPLSPRDGGLFDVTLEGLAEGARYKYRLDATRYRPDPASRFQPEGVHGDDTAPQE